MTPGPVAVAALALSAGFAATLVLLAASCRLVEPVDHPDKIPYRTLGRPSTLIGCGVTAALAMGLATQTVPSVVLAAWWVLSAVVVPLVTVDAVTTWLPWTLTWIAWAAMLGALGLITVRSGWPLAGRALVGAAIAGLVFGLVRLIFKNGIAFGDLRLALVLGAATAAGSWSLLSVGLWMGSVAGGAYALLRVVRRQSGPFPYAPSMMVGPYAGAILLKLWVWWGPG